MLEYLRKRPKCHVNTPFAQCDMGGKVYHDPADWQRMWFTLSELHWEAHMEGLLDCMREYVHAEAFKFAVKKIPSRGEFLAASVATAVTLFVLLI